MAVKEKMANSKDYNDIGHYHSKRNQSSKKDELRLYKTLQIPSDASQEEIKRAYKRLAFQYHPDKCSGQADKFQETKQAYDILSNIKCRQLYDQYGETGLAILSATNNVAIADALLNTKRLKLVFISITVQLVSLALFPSLIALKLADGLSSWTWSFIFLPLWSLDLLILILGYTLLYLCWKASLDSVNVNDVESVDDDDDGGEGGVDRDKSRASEQKVSKSTIIVGVILLSLAISFIFLQEILLMWKLDQSVSSSWWMILIPYLIMDGIRLLFGLFSIAILLLNWRQLANRVMSEDEMTLPYPKVYFTVKTLSGVFGRLATCTLLIYRSKTLNFPLLLAASPYILIHVGRIWWFDRRLALKRSIASDQQQQQTSIMPISWYHIKMTIIGYITVTLFMIDVRNYGSFKSWTIALSPIYLFSTLLTLLVILGGFILYGLIPTHNDLETRMGVSLSHNEFGWFQTPGFIFAPYQRLITRN